MQRLYGLADHPNSVTTIDYRAFSGCSSFTGSLTIPNSVTTIGHDAFWGCSGFTGSLTIPNSVTTIGHQAFYGCSGITNITSPSDLADIGTSAFYGTGWYNNQPDGLVYIGNVAYRYKGTVPSGSTLTLRSGIKGIAGGAFYGCSGFTGSLTIPNSVTTIGSSAFQNCSGFTGSLTIPNSVTTIGDYAFYECSGITNITIPSDLVDIGNSAFHGTGWYNNQPDGLVYIGNVAYRYKGTVPSGSTLTLRSGIKGIAGGAFYGCSGFTGSLTIPNSVTTIGSSAFQNCSGFTGSLTIPNTVTTIGYATFDGCSGFTGSLTIPNSVTTIGWYAFSGCSGFTGSLTIPNSVTSIGNCAFYNCSGMTVLSWNVVECSDFISTAAYRPFTGMTKLSVVTVGAGVKKIPARFLYDVVKTSGSTLSLPSSLTAIGSDAFHDCSGFSYIYSNIMIPDAVTYGTNVFYSVPSSSMVYVPCGTGPAYRTTAPWSSFTNIIEQCESVTYSVNIAPCEHGTVTADVEEAAEEDTVTVTAVPDGGYELVDIAVTDSGGDTVEITAAGDNSWTFTMPASDVTVTVTFAIPGDVNDDGVVDVRDANIIINVILRTDDGNDYGGRADVNGDGSIDVRDANAIINIILNS